MKAFIKTKTLNTSPKYTGAKVKSLIRGLKYKEIWCHLKLVQQNKVDRIKNNFNKNGYINKQDANCLWKYFNNFVLHDFRYPQETK